MDLWFCLDGKSRSCRQTGSSSEHPLACTARSWARILAALIICLIAMANPAKAAIVDFEAPPAGSTLTAQYANVGIGFNGPQVRDFASTPGFVRSGSKAIEVCFAAEFCSTPLSVTFASAQSRVAMWVGSSFPSPEARQLVLQAFDANGVQISQSVATLPVSANPTPTQIQIAVTAPTAAIRRVVLSFAAGPSGTYNTGLVVDDLEYDATGYAPCTAQSFPLLTLTDPTELLNVSADNFLLRGQVVTEGQLLEAALTVTGANGSKRVELLGSTIGFSGGSFATQLSGTLSPGQNELVLRVRNCRGNTQITRHVVLNAVVAGTRFRFLGLEVVQATQDSQNSVPLVADKPTIVRVFLGLEGSTSPVHGVAGDLVLSKPGTGPVPPVVHSLNAVTVDSTPLASKRASLDASLNFRLPPEHIGRSTVHIQLTGLTIGGFNSTIPCDGCQNLDSIGAPKWTQFQLTKPLNLVIVPYRYTRSPATQTPDLIFSPMGALQWVNNAFPIKGAFPLPGSGINLLRIMPMRDTGRNLDPDLDDGNDFLDELAELRSDLREQYGWPDDVRLLAMTPCGCGGRGEEPGTVTYADIANQESGFPAASSFGTYGSYWAHELAHNFGRGHALATHGEGDPDNNFPYPHGGLGQPGLAITTEWWDTSPKLFAPGTPAEGQVHAHDIMSYGNPNWVSPYTYKALFNKFVQTSMPALAPQTPRETLVIIGHVRGDGTVALRPLRRTVTGIRSTPDPNGTHQIQLLDRSGRVLASHRFTPAKIERSAGLSFDEYVEWSPGTQEILLRGPRSVLARRTVSANAPVVGNVRARPVKGGSAFEVSWTAGDRDSDALHATVFYQPRISDPWMPVASSSSNSATLDGQNLPGSRRGRLRVRVSDGVNTSEATGSIAIPRKAPAAAILGPATIRLKKGQSLSLAGAAYDAEDGLVSANSLTWLINKRAFATGAALDLGSLPIGRHAIVLQATDSDGRRGAAQTAVIVAPVDDDGPGKRKTP